MHSEAQTFDRRPAAAAWLKKREKDLEVPGAIERERGSRHTLGMAIARYIEESEKAIGRTKSQVLKSIMADEISLLPCDRVDSPRIVAYLHSLDAKPQTRANYASHLAAVFAVARPAWGYPLDREAMRDATTDGSAPPGHHRQEREARA
ncbi:MAG: hypothetical protein ABJF07_25150 [Nisaea sp.]|uniref:hypothetical protein n=1 Tax=Nisaea sp. TaxID=2024842 RepID=UPI003263456F